MITFVKITYDQLSYAIQRAVVSYDDKQVIIDDSKLTSDQLAEFTDFMTSNGYK